jgi:RNA binding exosome subunit
MTFTIPRPDWVSDRLIEERGPNAGFQMYTTEGNDAVAAMVSFAISQSETNRLHRDETIEVLKEGIKIVRKNHPEIHDTEPEGAVADAVNAFFATQGWVRVDRDDLFW